MPPKKKRRNSKAASPSRSHKIKVAVAALFLLGFLISCLVLLAQWRESYRHTATPAASVPEVTFEVLRGRIGEALVRSGVSPRGAAEDLGGADHSVIEEPFPDEAEVGRLDGLLSALSPHLALETDVAESELRILWKGSPRYMLRFAPPPVTPEGLEGGARMAIIMDDLGRDVATARELLAIDLPVTFAVLPNTPQAALVATVAHRGGREVIIHLPMEPRNYPERDPGYDALLLALSREEIRLRMSEYLDRIPYAVGGNNHMGSRFTESRRAMGSVLEVMEEEGLFFVDSLTTGRSVAYEEARRRGIPAAVRDVFLDNEREVAKISAQLRRLAQTAAREGQAIGICHPYPETLEALRLAVPYLEEAEVTVVPVSRLLQR